MGKWISHHDDPGRDIGCCVDVEMGEQRKAIEINVRADMDDLFNRALAD